jgi:hypothetical protein
MSRISRLPSQENLRIKVPWPFDDDLDLQPKPSWEKYHKFDSDVIKYTDIDPRKEEVINNWLAKYKSPMDIEYD